MWSEFDYDSNKVGPADTPWETYLKVEKLARYMEELCLVVERKVGRKGLRGLRERVRAEGRRGRVYGHFC